MKNFRVDSRRNHAPETGSSLPELLIIVAIIGIIAAIGVPRLTAAKHRAHAASAVASLRSIATSQIVYNQTRGGYADFAALSESGLMPNADLISGIKSGYTFALSVNSSPEPGYTATAEPIDPSYGMPSYFVDETGVIRFEVSGTATAASAPVR
jgi:type IV pilus assembly protein PilE